MTSSRRARPRLPRKPAIKVALAEVIRWLDQHQVAPRGTPGRPRTGQIGLSTAIAQAFHVHVRTAKRLLIRARRRQDLDRAHSDAQAGVDGATASLMRALTERYVPQTVTAHSAETVTRKHTPSRVAPKQLASKPHTRLGDIYDEAVVAAVDQWFQAAPEAVKRRLLDSLPRDSGRPSRNLQDVGLRVLTSASSARYDPVEGLIEAMEAALVGSALPTDARQRTQDLHAQLTASRRR